MVQRAGVPVAEESIVPLTKSVADRRRKLVMKLVLLKSEAMRLGLTRTAHALEEPEKVVGWEMSAHMNWRDKHS